MIIERLDLIAFGRFAEESIDLSAEPVRFHLVYGPNESGKSTSLRAIHALLFGMPHRCDDDFLHGYKRMRVGGRLRDPLTAEVIECVRKRGRQKTLLTPDEKKEIDPARIAAMLRGVDGSTFTRQFGLTHHELVAGGRAIVEGGGDLGEILFAAGAGAAALRTVKQQLEKDRAALFLSRGSAPTLNKLLREYQDLAKELRALRLLPAAYDAKHRELEQATAEVQALGKRLREQNERLQRLKAHDAALPLVHDRQSLVQRLAEIGDAIPLLDEAFSQRRRELEAQGIGARQQLEARLAQHAELQRRHDAIDVDPLWLAAAPRIKTLMNELGQVESDAQRLDDCRRTIDEANRRIQESIARLSRQPSPPASQQPADTAPQPPATLPGGALAAGSAAPCELSQQVDQRLQRLTINDLVRAEIEKLASEYGGLLQSLETAQEKVAALQRASVAAERELTALPPAPEPAPLVEALAAIGGNPHKLLEAVARAAAEAQQTQRRVETTQRKLHGFTGDAARARTLTLPTAAQIDEHTERLDRAQETIRRAAAGLQDAERRCAEARALLQREQGELAVPTAEQLEQQRCRRDALLDAIKSSALGGDPLSPDALDSLAQAIRRVDRMTDQMHLAHDQVVRRQRLSEDAVRAEQQVQQSQQQCDVAQADAAAALQRWQTLWAASGITASDPAAMRQWCADHARLLEQLAELDEKQAALAFAEEELARHREHLSSALRATAAPVSATAAPATAASLPGSAEGAELAASDLLQLHSLASARRDELNELKLRRAELEKNQSRLSHDLASAEDEQASCQRRWQQWQTRWDELTEPLADSQQVPPDAINRIIRTVDACHNLRRQRDEAREQIARGVQRRETYCQRLAAIAAELGLTPSANYADDVRQLAGRLDAQEKRAAEQQLLSDQIATLADQITAARETQQAADAKLQQLCAEARCQSAEELPQVEQASARRRQAEEELERIDRQLRQLAQSSQLDLFLEQTANISAEALRTELALAESSVQRLEEELGQQQRRLGQIEQEVRAMDGSDRAALVQQEQQNLLAAIRRHAEDYARLSIAQEALRRAIEHYRQHNEGPVLRLASRYFSRLTGGEYASLEVDFDDSEQPRLYGVRPAAATGPASGTARVVAGAMSDGTADALYLSLRLASLEVHLDTHQPIPLIVDDCLIQFDDGRAAAALQILSEIGRRTQVILFTHHQHLVELAAEHLPPDGFHLHRLDKPSP